jgi:hypothetical protein
MTGRALEQGKDARICAVRGISPGKEMTTLTGIFTDLYLVLKYKTFLWLLFFC